MTTEGLRTLIRDVVAEVLVVPPDSVGDDTALIGELGAESIDFLDLVFRLEERVGARIPIERWDAYLRTHAEAGASYDRITPAFVLGFVRDVVGEGGGPG